MSDQAIPRVGDIVIYQSDLIAVPAIVTKVQDRSTSGYLLNLTVFGLDGSTLGKSSIPYSESFRPGHWSWRPA